MFERKVISDAGRAATELVAILDRNRGTTQEALTADINAFCNSHYGTQLNRLANDVNDIRYLFTPVFTCAPLNALMSGKFNEFYTRSSIAVETMFVLGANGNLQLRIEAKQQSDREGARSSRPRSRGGKSPSLMGRRRPIEATPETKLEEMTNMFAENTVETSVPEEASSIAWGDYPE